MSEPETFCPPPPPPPFLAEMDEELPPPPPPPPLDFLSNVVTSSARMAASSSSSPAPPDGRSSSSLSGSSSKSRERKGERKEDRRDQKDEKKKRKEEAVKAGSLGELINEAKRTKLVEPVAEEAPEPMEVDEMYQADDLNEEIRQAQAKPSPDAELPRLTEEDLREPVILNPDLPFDPETMRVKSRAPSAQEVFKENNYVMSDGCSYSTNAARSIEQRFRTSVLDFLKESKSLQETPSRPPSPLMHDRCKCGDDYASEEHADDDDDDENDNETDIAKMTSKQRNKELLTREVERKRNHPSALSPDICFNEPGMSNDGPVCRCSTRTRTEGIRHNVFVGEEQITPCNPLSNNADRLYHYVLQVNNAINKPIDRSTQIRVGKDIFNFKGFSVFFHRPLPQMFPKNPISRWNTDIEFEFVQEPVPETFTVGESEAFFSYLVDHILDLFDFPRFPVGKEGSCPVFHIMPRFLGFVDGKASLLPMAKVLDHFASAFRPVFLPGEGEQKMKCSEDEWQRFNKSGVNQLLMNPQKRPSALRADSFTRKSGDKCPHFVQITVLSMSYMGLYATDQQQVQKQLTKMKKVHKMRKSPTPNEQKELGLLQKKLDDMKAYHNSIRNLNVSFSLEPFYYTGFYADVVAHVLTLSLACHHARLHMSFEKLEESINFRFANRSLLELAMTHPSFKFNYGMNADHAKNTLINCGNRRKFNSDKMEDIKRLGGGPRMAEQITSGGLRTKTVQVVHNERLEYLGDAVVEMEGGLATYRSAMVQNRNLAALAKNIGLHHWLLFTHGPDLCHEADFRHALANAFEAIMGAIYLDHGAEPADRIFSQAMFGDDPEAKQRWDVINEHELKTDLPDGDRHMIAEVPNLQMLTELEDRIGVEFKHIRVLAKAFTRRSVPWNELTRGHHQRLEWLGDTVLQLIVSDYLYRHFPYHHEGNLSLLRTCIVSNRTQAAICDEVGLCEFVIKSGTSTDGELKMKDKADLVESLLGAIFVDRGWEYCKSFIKVMFLPRLKYFLVENRWADDKSKLQQACLCLRRPNSKSQEVPTYRILSSAGPTNSRMYRVGVYFRDTRLAIGVAPKVHQAEMDAAKKALAECQELLPDADERHPRRRRPDHSSRPSNRPLASIPSLFSTSLLPPPNMLPMPSLGGMRPPFLGQPTPLFGHFYPPQQQHFNGNH